MPSQGIKALFGTASIGNNEPWIDGDYLERAFAILQSHGVDTLDSAKLYGESEKRLGEMKAGTKFTLDTKWPGGFIPGGGSREKIVEAAKDSIAKLGVKQVSRNVAALLIPVDICEHALAETEAGLCDSEPFHIC